MELVMLERIVDGDTVVLKEGKERVRLYGIDAPESHQLYGGMAKIKLEELIERHHYLYIVRQKHKDKYGRTLGILYGSDELTKDPQNYININLEMVRSGYAWAYRHRSRGYREYNIFTQAESDAREQRIGLWVDENPENPYDYRKRKKDHIIGGSLDVIVNDDEGDGSSMSASGRFCSIS